MDSPPMVSETFPAKLEEWDGHTWVVRGTATTPAQVRTWLSGE
jgi:hypothetical protein